MVPQPAHKVDENSSTISGITTATTSTSRSLQNPLSKFLQEREDKNAQKKAEKIAATRKKVELRLKPQAVPSDKLGRLEELKKIKLLAAEKNSSRSSPSSDAGNQGRKSQRFTLNIQRIWRGHGRPERIWTLLLFLLSLFVLLHVSDLVFFLVDVGQTTTWMGSFVGNIRVVVYLFLCALVHFSLLDAALIYSFDSVELGRKSFSHIKQGYADAAQLLTLMASGGIVAFSISAAMLLSGLRLASWYAIVYAEKLGEWLANTENRLFDYIPGAASSFEFAADAFSSALSSTLSVLAVLQNLASTVSYWTGIAFMWSRTVGLVLNGIYDIMWSIASFPLIWWNKKIYQVVLESETVHDFPSWRGDSLALARPFLSYSAVFFITILLLADVLITEETKKSPLEEASSAPSAQIQLNGTSNNIINQVIEEEKYEDGDRDITLSRSPSSASQISSPVGKKKQMFKLEGR